MGVPMEERGWIEPIVERVVGRVLESHTAQLSGEIIRQVMAEVASVSRPDKSLEEPAPATRTGATSTSADLARAVGEIQLGSSQREILRALLDTSARYAARVALFVVKGSHATGWQGRGFVNNDAVKDFALDENTPAVVRAIDRAIDRPTGDRPTGDRAGADVPMADLDARFLDAVGTPASGVGRILPLILKDKVAALVYADSGVDESGSLDAGALELLVLSTSAWLEVNSLRKQAHREPSGAHADSHSMPPAEVATYQAPAQPAPAFNDPFASHAPSFATGQAKAAAASAAEGSTPLAHVAAEASAMVAHAVTAESESVIAEVQSVVAMEPALSAPPPLVHAETAATPEAAPAASISLEDQDIHRKAQRFARLLVDEIKLYNQAQVAEGRKNKDLYDRLKEVIEKSRVTYQKRYGNTVAASSNYFDHEIMRSLAEDDFSIMGANFRQ